MCVPLFLPSFCSFFLNFFLSFRFVFFFAANTLNNSLKKNLKDQKNRKEKRISLFSHTHEYKYIYTNNVCCYSTNRVRRRPQGHQGSGAYSLLLILSFFLMIPISSSERSSHRARAFDDDANFLPYLILQKRIDVCDDARGRSDLRCALLVSPRERTKTNARNNASSRRCVARSLEVDPQRIVF